MNNTYLLSHNGVVGEIFVPPHHPVNYALRQLDNRVTELQGVSSYKKKYSKTKPMEIRMEDQDGVVAFLMWVQWL